MSGHGAPSPVDPSNTSVAPGTCLTHGQFVGHICPSCSSATTIGPGHGAPTPVDPAVFLSDDPALALVTADPVVWDAAHPCVCEALCVCDDQEAV